MDPKDMNINTKLPHTAINPPLPNGYYTKMEEAERYKEIIGVLIQNYNKLLALAELKEKELAESKAEAIEVKKHNTKMLIIALVSAGIAFASLVATVLIAVL